MNKKILASVFVLGILSTVVVRGQSTRTTVKDLGKVGNMHFIQTRSDTITMVGIAQGDAYTMNMVAFPQKEITEVIEVLNSYAAETKKNTSEQVILTDSTASLVLSCHNVKGLGWLIMIHNTDPALEKSAEVIQRKSGMVQYFFVTIKPNQLAGVVKIFSKAANN